MPIESIRSPRPPGDGQAPQNLLVQRMDIPIEAAADLPDMVREAVQLLHAEPAVAHAGQNDPPAGGTQIDGDDVFLHDGKVSVFQ